MTWSIFCGPSSPSWYRIRIHNCAEFPTVWQEVWETAGGVARPAEKSAGLESTHRGLGLAKPYTTAAQQQVSSTAVYCALLQCKDSIYRKFETYIPRKGIGRPLSQFPHSCVCERLIHSYVHVSVSVSDIFPRSICLFCCRNKCGPIPGNI